jgi:hypothetical protein
LFFRLKSTLWFGRKREKGVVVVVVVTVSCSPLWEGQTLFKVVQSSPGRKHRVWIGETHMRRSEVSRDHLKRERDRSSSFSFFFSPFWVAVCVTNWNDPGVHRVFVARVVMVVVVGGWPSPILKNEVVSTRVHNKTQLHRPTSGVQTETKSGVCNWTTRIIKQEHQGGCPVSEKFLSLKKKKKKKWSVVSGLVSFT